MKTWKMLPPIRSAALGALICAALAGAGGAPAQTAPSPGAPIAPAPPAPAGAAPGAPLCDAPCVQANMDRAARACARPIEAQAPFDFDWLNRPFAGIFLEADKSSAQNSIVAYRGDSIRFQTPQKEWIRVVYQCEYDAAAQKVVAVRVRPGRLDRPAPVNLSAAPPTRPPAAGSPVAQQPVSAQIAAAIARAAGPRGPRGPRRRLARTRPSGSASPAISM